MLLLNGIRPALIPLILVGLWIGVVKVFTAECSLLGPVVDHGTGGYDIVAGIADEMVFKIA